MSNTSLSKKRETELYSEVHEQIMQSRIKINRALKGVCHITIQNEIDNILSDLCMKAPLKAIQLFTIKNKK